MSNVDVVRIGISPFASNAETALELAAMATNGGLDTLWLGDGYLANPDFAGWAGGMETFTELAWLSGRHPSARVGITAAVLPIRDIVWMAKQSNTLHRVAGGGFVVVAAPGFWKQDLEARGLSFARRGSLFDAALDELLAALDDTSFSPGPPDGGAPPVWLAGSTHTMQRAIDRGLTFQSSRAIPDQLETIASDFFQRGGTKLAHRVRVEVGDHGVTGEELDWHAVTGSVDQIVEALGRFRDMGVFDLSIIPGQDDATSLRTLRTLVDDVLPQLADSPG